MTYPLGHEIIKVDAGEEGVCNHISMISRSTTKPVEEEGERRGEGGGGEGEGEREGRREKFKTRNYCDIIALYTYAVGIGHCQI